METGLLLEELVADEPVPLGPVCTRVVSVEVTFCRAVDDAVVNIAVLLVLVAEALVEVVVELVVDVGQGSTSKKKSTELITIPMANP